MPREPAHADPASEPGDPVPTPDWMTEDDWLAWCDAAAVDDEPPGLDGWDEEEPAPEPGEPVTGAARFAEGGVVDGLAGGCALALFADAAAGAGDRYAGGSDDELDGAI